MVVHVKLIELVVPYHLRELVLELHPLFKSDLFSSSEDPLDHIHAHIQIIFFLFFGQFEVLSEQYLFPVDFKNSGKFISIHGVTSFVESIFNVLGWNLVNKYEEEELVEIDRAILVNIGNVKHVIDLLLVVFVEVSLGMRSLELEWAHCMKEHCVAHGLLSIDLILGEMLVNLLRTTKESDLVVIETVL